MQRRKHTKQMTPSERDVIRKAIQSLDPSTLSTFNRYVEHRIAQRRLTREDILHAVRDGDIIEAHNNKKKDIRILLRHQTSRGFSVCAVVSLREGSVITAYRNYDDDHHYTIDWDEYKWKANLVSEVKRFMYRRYRGAIRF